MSPLLMALLTVTGTEMEPLQYSMILPGIVYDGSAESDDDWFGLFLREDGSCELEQVDFVLVQMDSSGIYPDERPPGTLVRLPEGMDSPLVLVTSSLPVFTEGPVPTCVGSRTSLPADTCFSLGSDGIGEVLLETNDDGLFVSARGITQHVTDTRPGNNPLGTFLEIIWAGDLDGDGRLDMLLNDVSNSYLIYEWVLYLSTEASGGELMEEVASFFDVYY